MNDATRIGAASSPRQNAVANRRLGWCLAALALTIFLVAFYFRA